jgi:hypothetical protein
LVTIKPEDLEPLDLVNIDGEDDYNKEDKDFSTLNDGNEYEHEEEEEEPEGRRKLLRKSQKGALSSTQKVDRNLQSQCSSFKVIEVAIAFDSTFCSRLGSGSSTRAKQAAQNIVATASVSYQRQGVCAKIKISHLEGYCNPSTDLYSNIVRNGDMSCSNATSRSILGTFTKYWRANRSGISRDTAHLFFGQGKPGSTIGCASVNRVCSKSSGYGVNDMSSSNSRTTTSRPSFLCDCVDTIRS